MKIADPGITCESALGRLPATAGSSDILNGSRNARVLAAHLLNREKLAACHGSSDVYCNGVSVEWSWMET